jgi:hypothetical protein
MLMVDEHTALISDLFDHYLTVADLSNLNITGKIDLNGHTSESMVKTGNKVFVANWSEMNQQVVNDKILVVDINSMKLTDSIQVTKEPNSMVIDKNNKLWVLCGGGYDNQVTPALFKVNPATNYIEAKLEFPDKNCNPFSLSINGSGNQLYFINGDIFRMQITENVIPGSAWVSSNENNFYSLNVRPDKEEVFVSDALNYVRNGKVFVYNENGNKVNTFNAGIIPGYFTFVQ